MIPTTPLILDLTSPADIERAASLEATRATTPVYWISTHPPEHILGRLVADDLQGAWLDTDRSVAWCRIGPGAPVAVRLPAEISEAGITAFLRDLIHVCLRVGSIPWSARRHPIRSRLKPPGTHPIRVPRTPMTPARRRHE